MPSDYKDTFLNAPSQVGLAEGIGDSRIFRDLEYAFCLQHIKEGSKILDVGSSQPWFLLELARRHCAVTTIDVNPEAMEIHRKFDVQCKRASVTNLPFQKDEFSMALCISTMEHVHGDEDIQGMKEIRRVSPKLLLALPVGKADNWHPNDPDKERQYNMRLLKNRILKGWKVLRRAEIAVWDPNIPSWLSENCFYLQRI